MDEILILVKKVGGGYRAAVYKSGFGAKTQEEFAADPITALEHLIENHLK